MGAAVQPNGKKTIWIDLDNTPHVPFFAPIIAELEKRGYTILLTARHQFQLCALADLFQFKYQRVGRHYGKNRLFKVSGTVFRAMQLLPIAKRGKPAIAVSHGSRSQMVSAAMAGIPSLVIFDYEHTRKLPGLPPTWAMVPQVVPDAAIRSKCGVLKYPGIKEDAYVPTFKPDDSLRAYLGLEEKSIVVTLRPPANEAHYHNPESEKLLEAAIDVLRNTPDTKIVLLPRNSDQAEFLKKAWPELFANKTIIIPDSAVDGLNLIWHSDLVISGGGTMNREAAAMGVPVYSIFRGTIGAVDRYLSESGRLILLESAADVRKKLAVKHRDRSDQVASEQVAPGQAGAGNTLNAIVNHIVTLTESGSCK